MQYFDLVRRVLDTPHDKAVVDDLYKCHTCGREETVEVLRVATMMPGDELNGCDQYAMDTKHEDGWWHHSPDCTQEFIYCPTCWLIRMGEAYPDLDK